MYIQEQTKPLQEMKTRLQGNVKTQMQTERRNSNINIYTSRADLLKKIKHDVTVLESGKFPRPT